MVVVVQRDALTTPRPHLSAEPGGGGGGGTQSGKRYQLQSDRYRAVAVST